MGFVDHTAFERMHQALECLAVSTAPLQDRLGHAGVAIVPLDASDFREGGERDLFRRIIAKLTASGDVTTTSQGLDDTEARALAQDLMSLYFSVIDGSEPGPLQREPS